MEKELDRVPVALETEPEAKSRNKKGYGGAQIYFELLMSWGMTEACLSSACVLLYDVQSLLPQPSVS